MRFDALLGSNVEFEGRWEEQEDCLGWAATMIAQGWVNAQLATVLSRGPW